MGKWIFKYEFPYKNPSMVPKFYIIDGGAIDESL